MTKQFRDVGYHAHLLVVYIHIYFCVSISRLRRVRMCELTFVRLYRSACIRGSIYVRAHWTDETNAVWSTVDALNLAPVEHTFKEYM